MHLEINDTGGQEEYLKRNREIAYQGADVFIICVPTCSKNNGKLIQAYADDAREQTKDKNIPILLIRTMKD